MTIVMIFVGFFSFILVSFHRNDGGQDGVGPKLPTLLPVQSFNQHWFFSFVLKKGEEKKKKCKLAGKENYGKGERRIHSEESLYPPV